MLVKAGNYWLYKRSMSVLVVLYPKCSTCQKALKWLEQHNISHTTRHIVSDKPSREELQGWIEASQLPIQKWFNTSGQKYRQLGLKDEIKHASVAYLLGLLASDGMLVKRPVVISPQGVVLGYKPEQYATLFGCSL